MIYLKISLTILKHFPLNYISMPTLFPSPIKSHQVSSIFYFHQILINKQQSFLCQQIPEISITKIWLWNVGIVKLRELRNHLRNPVRIGPKKASSYFITSISIFSHATSFSSTSLAVILFICDLLLTLEEIELLFKMLFKYSFPRK